MFKQILLALSITLASFSALAYDNVGENQATPEDIAEATVLRSSSRVLADRYINECNAQLPELKNIHLMWTTLDTRHMWAVNATDLLCPFYHGLNASIEYSPRTMTITIGEDDSLETLTIVLHEIDGEENIWTVKQLHDYNMMVSERLWIRGFINLLNIRDTFIEDMEIDGMETKDRENDNV